MIREWLFLLIESALLSTATYLGLSLLWHSLRQLDVSLSMRCVPVLTILFTLFFAADVLLTKAWGPNTTLLYKIAAATIFVAMFMYVLVMILRLSRKRTSKSVSDDPEA